MKAKIISIRIAGAICLLFTVFHCFFYTMFQWETTLSCLSVSDRSILLTYHWISILICGFMTILSLFQTQPLIESKLKYTILTMFCLFFLIRIIAEFIYFGITPGSWVILPLCFLPLVLFSIPLFNNKKQVL
jgi:hypothetical protein